MTDDTVIEAPETETVAGKPAKQPLTPEEYDRRLGAATRDLREQRREIAALREAIQMRPQLNAEIKADTSEPDMDADPIGWMKYAKGELDAFKKERAEADKQAKAEQEQHAQLAQLGKRMDEYESEFREDHADYNDAVQFFQKARIAELKDEGVTDGEMTRALQQSFSTIVARAINSGKDPAEVVYKLAKNRGFGVDKPDKKLETIERAAQAGRSLSQGSTRTGDGELTFEYVSSLKGKEFTEAFARLKAQAKAAEKAQRRA
jgi:hypothetical protein